MTAYHRQKEIQRFYGEDHPYVLRISELEERVADLERQLADMMHSRDCWKLECATADARAEQAEQRLADLERQLAEATTWRSPDTAPRDGTSFLGICKYEAFSDAIHEIVFCVQGRWWAAGHSFLERSNERGTLVGWLPLPKEDV